MAITRRNMLRATGLGVGAAAVAALSSGCLPAAGSEVGPPDWEALRKRLAGTLTLPSDSGYATAKQAYNPDFDSRQPAAVLRCANASDIQAGIEAARGRVPIAARGGGHSYAGYSTPDGGLILDTGDMKSVQVRADGTAVIGAGARLIDVYTSLAQTGRCLPGGSCPTVGIAGLTLGGGVGVLAGKYGLTCDNLISAQVVTADGVLRTASANSEPDLYWALRGGGGGNFGVVTELTFRTVAAPQLGVFQMKLGGPVSAVLNGWQSFTHTAPDEFWSTLAIPVGLYTCRITGCYVGTESNMRAQIDKLVAAIGVQPSSSYKDSMEYLPAMRYFGGCSNYTAEQCRPEAEGGVLPRETFTATSRVLTKPIADPDRFSEVLANRNGMDILLDSLMGAPSRIGAADTAFPHRGALGTAQIYYGKSAQDARTAVSELRDGLGELTGNTGFVNYIDPTLKDWGTAYYGGNAQRLRGIAKHYDPDGVFSFAQSVSKM
ncbi:FAD-dependent oxidoreductase [Nocardia sp. NPDC051030]|uniref:FAD-binding oxidoreductase n=1 Tax=Nocardia sp. NPDC051030 TaxID=3155162 RepID=UPI0034366FEA